MKKIITLLFAALACTQVMAWEFVAEKRTDDTYGGYYFSNRPCPGYSGYVAFRVAGETESADETRVYCWEKHGEAVYMKGRKGSMVLSVDELSPIKKVEPIHLLLKLQVLNK